MGHIMRRSCDRAVVATIRGVSRALCARIIIIVLRECRRVIRAGRPAKSGETYGWGKTWWRGCSDDDDDKRRKYAPSRLMCARLKLSRAQAKPSEIDIK